MGDSNLQKKQYVNMNIIHIGMESMLSEEIGQKNSQ